MTQNHNPHRRTLLRIVAGGTAIAWLPRAGWAVPELDQSAPALRGKLLDGQAFDLAALRGKVVLVNFYSSYCKYCAYEIGNVETYYEEHKAQGFEVLAIGVDRLEDKPRVARSLGIYGLPGAMLQELEINEFGTSYPTPTCFVIDRRGVLRQRLWGAKTPPQLKSLVSALLDEK